jgi:hypothetical protein
MYAYYASSCFGLRWPRFLARIITTLQLTQMFANLALVIATFACCGPNYHISCWPTAAMYTVYACLFMDLYMQRYTAKFTQADATKANGEPQYKFISLIYCWYGVPSAMILCVESTHSLSELLIGWWSRAAAMRAAALSICYRTRSETQEYLVPD